MLTLVYATALTMILRYHLLLKYFCFSILLKTWSCNWVIFALGTRKLVNKVKGGDNDGVKRCLR